MRTADVFSSFNTESSSIHIEIVWVAENLRSFNTESFFMRFEVLNAVKISMLVF
jgi:hypothetical protein